MKAFVCAAILLSACGSEPDRAVADTDGAPADTDARVPDGEDPEWVDPGFCVEPDPCSRGTCVDLCGDRVVVRAGDPWKSGDVTRANIPPRWTVRIGDKVVQLDGAALVVRDAQTLALEGALWLGWYARELTSLSDSRVVLQTAYGSVFVDVDGAGQPSIAAVWESVRLLAGQADRVVVSTRAGFAIVDATSPAAPRALDCAEWPLPGTFFPSQSRLVDGRFLLAGSSQDDGGGAWLYDVDAVPMRAIARLPGPSPHVTLEGDRLVVFAAESAREGIMFEVGDYTLNELWRYPGLHGTPWDDVVVGGMLALGGGYEAPRALIDLQADGAETYHVVETVGCGWVVESDLTGERVGLEVAGDRSVRVAPDAIRTSGCERTAMANRAVQFIVREPARPTLLAVGDDAWWLLDANTFEVHAAPFNGYLGGWPLWIGDAIYVIAGGGGDWGMRVPTTITVRDPTDLTLPARTVARDFTAYAHAAGDRLWSLSEPAVAIYDGPRSPLADRIIWSVGGDDAVTIEDYPELDDLEPIAIAAAGDTLWVLDDRGFVRRWRAGVHADSAPFARLDEPTLVASSLGLFITDAAGAFIWIDDALQRHTAVAAPECVTRTVVAADDDHVYVREQRPGLNLQEPATELIVATPRRDGGTLRLDFVARVPGAPRVFVGDPVVLVDALGLRSLRFDR